jgi:hypothetical protein
MTTLDQAEYLANGIEDLEVWEIAQVISRDWTRPFFGAVPYLDALRSMSSVDDSYGLDDGRMIVAYFLSNATTWRGPIARIVKAELKRRTK